MLESYLVGVPEEGMAATWVMNSAYTWYVEEFRKSPDWLEDALESTEKQRLRRKKTRCYAATFWGNGVAKPSPGMH